MNQLESIINSLKKNYDFKKLAISITEHELEPLENKSEKPDLPEIQKQWAKNLVIFKKGLIEMLTYEMEAIKGEIKAFEEIQAQTPDKDLDLKEEVAKARERVKAAAINTPH